MEDTTIRDLIKGALKYRDNLLQRFAGDRLHAVGNEAAVLEWDKTIRAYSTTWKNNMGINKEKGEHHSEPDKSFYCTQLAARS